MYSCGYSFRLPPLKVRDLRLDLEKTISFSDSLLGGWVSLVALLLEHKTPHAYIHQETHGSHG